MSTRIVVLGGGPAGYEAALVGAQYGADVTVVDSDGIGGACVLYDCVPSKTFIATTGVRTDMRRAQEMGVEMHFDPRSYRLDQVNSRVRSLAQAQSADIRSQLQREGVRLLQGKGKIVDPQPGLAQHTIEVTMDGGRLLTIEADIVLIATGSSPRVLPDARPDGERILTWRQVYDLEELPEHLVVVGSGVTGAEFVSAFTEVGVKVTMVSSRDRVLPHEDADAALVLEEALSERGVSLVKHARADVVEHHEDGIIVRLSDGRTVTGSHALMCVGSIPNTQDLGLETVGIKPLKSGHIPVDRVSRTAVPNIYAAGDCTDLFPLASVAAMQGRVAMYHA
ncbi:NAD(P)H-quinone dehydrogenase, partial [Dietzia sp.]|uniref:NAD(P)H-quinone dehydrogenase n=1 Tax=Dietzia sp. TaxID=1871616 RepID=UPI002FD96456